MKLTATTVRAVAGGLALAAAAAVVAALAAEVILAIADYPPAVTDHQRLFVEYDSVRGWRNIPNGHGRYVTPEFTVSMDYNARAYRGPAHEYAKPAGVFRVLLLGDSYVEGYTVTLQDRFAEVAERSLLSDSGGRRVEFITLGTGGYSTDQELLWLDADGLRYRPDLIVVLFVTNDIWYNTQSTYPRGAKPMFRLAGDSLMLTNVPLPRTAASTPAEMSRPGGVWRAAKRFVRGHSRLVRLAERAVRRTASLRWLGLKLGLVEDPAVTVDVAGQRASVPAEFQVFADQLTAQADSALTLTAKLLARMKARALSAGAELVVLLVPPNDALYPPGAPQSTRFSRRPVIGDVRRPAQRFGEICRRAGVRCVDPTPQFVAVAESLARRGELLVFPEDGHWNEHGHRAGAAAVVRLVHEATGAGHGP